MCVPLIGQQRQFMFIYIYIYIYIHKWGLVWLPHRLKNLSSEPPKPIDGKGIK